MDLSSDHLEVGIVFKHVFWMLYFCQELRCFWVLREIHLLHLERTLLIGIILIFYNSIWGRTLWKTLPENVFLFFKSRCNWPIMSFTLRYVKLENFNLLLIQILNSIIMSGCYWLHLVIIFWLSHSSSRRSIFVGAALKIRNQILLFLSRIRRCKVL